MCTGRKCLQLLLFYLKWCSTTSRCLQQNDDVYYTYDIELTCLVFLARSLSRSAGSRGRGDRVFQRSCRALRGPVVLCRGVLSPARPRCLEASGEGSSTAHHLEDSSQRHLCEDLQVLRVSNAVNLSWSLEFTTNNLFQSWTTLLITFHCLDALHALCWSKLEWKVLGLCCWLHFYYIHTV